MAASGAAVAAWVWMVRAAARASAVMTVRENTPRLRHATINTLHTSGSAAVQRSLPLHATGSASTIGNLWLGAADYAAAITRALPPVECRSKSAACPLSHRPPHRPAIADYGRRVTVR